jgi:hypothetical protein
VTTFNEVLVAAGVDPAHVVLARHHDTRALGGSIYQIWKRPGGRDDVEDYQATQSRNVFPVGGYVASFIVTPPPQGETLFIGLYQVRGRGKRPVGKRDPVVGIDVSA